jgi:transcriptional regulator with XRE-family HTH domain
VTGAVNSPGAALRGRRRALRLTQAQLAALFGCSSAALCHAETGLRTPPREWWASADGLLGAGGELLRLADGVLAGPDPLWPAWDDGRGLR